MAYLISQIFAYLLFALLLGLLLGWVIWGWRGRYRIDQALAEGETSLRNQRVLHEAEKDSLEATIKEQALALTQAQAALHRRFEPAKSKAPPPVVEEAKKPEMVPPKQPPEPEPTATDSKPAEPVKTPQTTEPRETGAVETEGLATSAPRPASLYESRPEEVDDLKQIKGIGPVMERILNEKGCYHFKQLASFSEQDIAWVSAAIETFPKRIERDRWVEQAGELHLAKYGERHDVDP